MRTLFEKIGILNLRYEKLRDDNEFNVFSLLRNRYDEVNLHSRFIFELLNPKGSHRLKTLFLELFLETLQINNFDLTGVNVRKESGDIDILITSKNQAVIIENKIGAGDQYKQIERYYKNLKNKGDEKIWIVYLTLNGHEPSTQSTGNLEKKLLEDYLITASYETDISEWLDKCIEKSARLPALRETLVQYQKLVQEITGNTMSMEQANELLELLSQDDNIHKAVKIAKNWNIIRQHVEFSFWKDFEAIIEAKGIKLLPNQKYSEQKIQKIINVRTRRNPWFGLMFELFSIEDDKICLYIERGWNVPYYGIIGWDDVKRTIIEDDRHKLLAQEIRKKTDLEKVNHWMCRNVFSIEINFSSFSEKETLDLIKKEKRDEFLNAAWEQIETLIKQVKEIKENLEKKQKL